jgi:hypothetical protein
MGWEIVRMQPAEQAENLKKIYLNQEALQWMQELFKPVRDWLLCLQRREVGTNDVLYRRGKHRRGRL